MDTKRKVTAKNKTKGLLSDEDLRPENIKCTISISMTGDLLDAYRSKAKALGIGYQTLMQIKLREVLDHNNLEARVSALEYEVKQARRQGLTKSDKKVKVKKDDLNGLINKMTFRTDWSEEDKAHIAHALEHVSIKAHADTPEDAIRELKIALSIALPIMIQNGDL